MNLLHYPILDLYLDEHHQLVLELFRQLYLTLKRSLDDIFIAVAASKVFFGSLHKMVAHPSGEMTEYIAF
uniref:Uncharacterized protein n=1 Tax=uncultured SAR11 cluster alpha proteobacterium H17925_48B19 TaxID=715039 RepID=E7CA79_9PROT|nr:hypothetical protein [uncultured SAR11 cluster alpha proteobacterium H17925_48B19]